MESLNKFRSTNVLNRSHKLHGLTLCAKLVFNMIFKWLPQSNSEFQSQIQPQRPGSFTNASQRRAPIGRWVKKNRHWNRFEHGEVINYTLGGVSNTPSHYKDTSFLPNLVAREEGNHSGIHREADGDFKTELMAVIGDNWGWINNIAVIWQY